MSTDQEFGKWRAFFWPVHKHELKKFFPMLLMYCLIAFVYGILRPYKESLVITAAESGAEVLPFIKVWVILPSAFLLMFLFTRLSNRFGREKVFYIMMSVFLVFYTLFAFILFPAHEALHPHEIADTVQALLPPGLKGLIALFRNWTFTLFYVMSDLWSTAILSVLFWGFANEVTSVKEAKRFYVLWSIGANLAGIFAAQLAVKLSGKLFLSWLPYGKSGWDQSVLFVNCIVIVCGMLTILLFRYVSAQFPSEEPKGITLSKRPKMSMKNNFAYLLKSRYLLYIAIIVLAYNLTINLFDIVWKNQIKEVYPNAHEFSSYMGQVMTWMGVIATVISIFVSGNFIRRCSWTTSALMTPLITLVSGSLFFFCVVSHNMNISSVFAALGASPLMLTVMFGSLHSCMARACKQTLFDATKEMSFIPLDTESKLNGKAAIDGVGSRIGKSGGSIVHQGLLIVFSTVAASSPYVAAVFFLVVIGWIFATISLGKQFNELTQRKEEELAPN